MVCVILFSFVPFLLDIYSWYYFIAVFLGVDLFLVYCIISLYRDTSSENVAKIQKQMKIDIFVGLGAICLG
jgi:heme/copper-type cytochrome/quinol oxidase subunit 2